MEARKHIHQMTKSEINCLRRIMRKQHYRFTEYSMDRVITRGITNYEVMGAIRNGEIIEFHVAKGSPRVRLRDETTNKKNQCTCVVIDLVSEIIATSYKNHMNDKHWKLNKELYSNDLDVIDIISQTVGV